MPVTYFKVKPESAMYKNFFIENTERKKLKKHISEFMKNHFGNGKHEVWTTLYPSLGIYSNHRIVVFNVRTLCRNFTFVQKEKGQAL